MAVLKQTHLGRFTKYLSLVSAIQVLALSVWATDCIGALTSNQSTMVNGSQFSENEFKTWSIHFRGSEFKVQQVPELESRVSFTHAKIKLTNSELTTKLIREYFPEVEDSVAALAKNRFSVSQSSGKARSGVWLAPLKSKFEILHDTLMTQLETGGAKPRGSLDLTTQFAKSQDEPDLPNSKLFDVVGDIDPKILGRDQVHIVHWASWYSETGIYFDTPEQLLEKNGWAVRIKILSDKNRPMSTQYFIPDEKSMQHAKRKTLTIKYSPGLVVGPFTKRMEYHVFLPLDFSMSDANELAMSVLNSIDTAYFKSIPNLVPVARVDTNRLGLNVIAQLDPEQKPEKIGFMTIDQFSRFKNAPERDYPKYQGAGIQTELEMLPYFFALLSTHPTLWADIVKLANGIQSFGGSIDNHPKYLTPQIIAPAGPVDR